MPRGAEDDIYRVDTIPPPDGEADPYSAPTKVGPLARAAMQAAMQTAMADRARDQVMAALPSPYADIDEADELDSNALFDGGGPCRQSGKTQLLAITLPISAAVVPKQVRIVIPAREPELSIPPIPEPPTARRGSSWLEIAMIILCVSAIAVPCAWFLLLR
jgi:hypothetical protein